ncbi:hypothetical protein DPMN_173026, partial [Dreissena polymorpha]
MPLTIHIFKIRVRVRKVMGKFYCTLRDLDLTNAYVGNMPSTHVGKQEPAKRRKL